MGLLARHGPNTVCTHRTVLKHLSTTMCHTKLKKPNCKGHKSYHAAWTTQNVRHLQNILVWHKLRLVRRYTCLHNWCYIWTASYWCVHSIRTISCILTVILFVDASNRRECRGVCKRALTGQDTANCGSNSTVQQRQVAGPRRGQHFFLNELLSCSPKWKLPFPLTSDGEFSRDWRNAYSEETPFQLMNDKKCNGLRICGNLKKASASELTVCCKINSQRALTSWHQNSERT